MSTVENEQSEAPSSEPEANSTEPKVEIASEELQKFTDSINNSNALYLAEIKNTGDVAVKISDISIDLEDINGEILKSSPMVSAAPSLINPGESAYICQDLLSVGDEITLEQIGKPILHYQVDKHEPRESLDVEFSELKLSDKYGRPNLVGRIENKSSEELKQVFIASPIKDADGKLQTVILGMVDSLAPGEKKGFEQMALYVNSSLDISAYTYGEPLAYLSVFF